MLTPKEIRSAKRKLKGGSRDLLRMFDALRDPCRFRIFSILLDQKEVCVTDVANILDTSLPVASRQLKILEVAGLVEKERMGQTVCYRLSGDRPLVPRLASLVTQQSN